MDSIPWKVEQEENATYLLQYFANFGDQLPTCSELKDPFKIMYVVVFINLLEPYDWNSIVNMNWNIRSAMSI